MRVEPEAKTLTLDLKADAEGEFSATFATLNVIDHHGDVTLPGAFEAGKEVLIGGYQHDMLALPVGKGAIHADEERAWVEGAFCLDTQPGADTYKTVKNAAGLMEWSYIFRTVEASDGDFETDRGTVPVRLLKKLDVWSVDPVLKGAGIRTGTDRIKGLGPNLTFLDHAAGIAAAVDEFLARVKERAAIRTKEGRVLSAANVDRLGATAESLKSAAADLEQLLAAAKPQKADFSRAFDQFQRSLALLAGVPLNT